MRRATAANIGRQRRRTNDDDGTSRRVSNSNNPRQQRNSNTTNTQNRNNNNNNNNHHHNVRPPTSSSNSKNQNDGGAAPPPMEPDMKCMSVGQEGSRIAFAYYDEGRNEIVLEDSPSHDRDIEQLVQGYIASTRPNLVLVSAKIAANANLLDLLTRCPPDTGGGLEGLVESGQQRTGSAGSAMNIGVTGRTPRSAQPDPLLPEITAASQSDRSKGISIPYRLLKSSAFDLKNCKSLILNKLRVMTLLRSSTTQSMAHHPQQNMPPQGHEVNTNAFQRQDASTTPGFSHYDNSTTPVHTTAPPSRYNTLASIVDFDSSALLRALGSLLCFLQNTIFRLEEGSTVTVNAISYARSSRFMRIDNTTLKALHIFATEHHPLIAKGHGKEKEGFSLFTLLDRTKSKIGRQCLREWMLKPLLDSNAIRERHDGIDLFLKPDFQAHVITLLDLLRQIGSVDKILVRMQRCHSAPTDFIVLSKTLSAAMTICSTLKEEFRETLAREMATVSAPHAGIGECAGEGGDKLCNDDILDDITTDYPRLRNDVGVLDRILYRCHVPVLRDLHERMTSIVDVESTVEMKESVVIHFGYHEDLDNAKEAFDTLDETLSAVGSQVLEKHPELEQLKVVFLPQVGFLIAVDKRNHSHNVASNDFPDLPEDFTFVFIQENDAFFKNPHMRQLDGEIGDLDAFIKDTESMIVSELEEDILDCETELRSTFGALAELDCILSFTSCAADLNFIRPEVLDSNSTLSEQTYYIENGRHPLQELIIDDEFIANDTDVDESKRLNVITGPNFSGKSCYTRQVGLLVYLAHIGCFLPCDQAKISITDQIMARISCIETCAVPQSSFQLDLTQMGMILRRSTERTLVLIDEFGKGTAPVSGIAVLTAALKKLSTLRCTVMCTTHFLEIFSLGLLVDGIDGIKVLQMAVHIPDSNEDDAVPLFKLGEGVANSSAGLVCAKMAGVHSDVIYRAHEILGALKNGQPVRPIPANINSKFENIQSSAKHALRLFLKVKHWANASGEELDTLHRYIKNI